MEDNINPITEYGPDKIRRDMNNDLSSYVSYGQSEQGVLAGEERDEVLINKIENSSEVRAEPGERPFRDEIESEGSQDPYSE